MREVKERFESKILKTDSCWLWQASKNLKGYGVFDLNGKSKSAHRFSYEFYKGEIGEGLSVCHSCDVPSCVNPDHLWLGTAKNNALDRDFKGRANLSTLFKSGENHVNSSLTELDVLKIFELRKDGLLHREIASIFNLSRQAISKILIGHNWKHLTVKLKQELEHDLRTV